MVLSEDDISIDNLNPMFRHQAGETVISDEKNIEGLSSVTDRAERDIIVQALEKCGGDRSRTAKILGIPRSTLYYKLKKFDINIKK